MRHVVKTFVRRVAPRKTAAACCRSVARFVAAGDGRVRHHCGRAWVRLAPEVRRMAALAAVWGQAGMARAGEAAARVRLGAAAAMAALRPPARRLVAWWTRAGERLKPAGARLARLRDTGQRATARARQQARSLAGRGRPLAARFAARVGSLPARPPAVVRRRPRAAGAAAMSLLVVGLVVGLGASAPSRGPDGAVPGVHEVSGAVPGTGSPEASISRVAVGLPALPLDATQPAPATVPRPRERPDVVLDRPSHTTRALRAIRRAARETGLDFGLLVAIAQRESSLNPRARARRSSAHGLFQFTAVTWLRTVERFGATLRIPGAHHVTRLKDGRMLVTDWDAREVLLMLRADPWLNARAAAHFLRAQKRSLREALGREPRDGELYLAHFLGLPTARRVLQAADETPKLPARGLVRAAAVRANPGIFEGTGGKPRTVVQLVAWAEAAIARARLMFRDRLAEAAPERPAQRAAPRLSMAGVPFRVARRL